MDKLSDEFKGLTKSNCIPTEVQLFLADKECFSVKSFANWVDKGSELQGVVLDLVNTHKADRGALANLKQLWLECVGIRDRILKRTSEGLSDVAIDEALPSAMQDQLQATWMARYNFDTEGKYRPSHSLLGRIRREFERETITMFPIRKVRSLYESTRSDLTKKHKASEAITILVGTQEEEEETRGSKFRDVKAQFEILINGWALAGSLVPAATPGAAARTELCIYWPEACKYYRELTEKTEVMLDKYTEASVVSYLLALEEHHRKWALEKLRVQGASVTFGQALMAALKDQVNSFYDYSNILVPRKAEGQGQQGQGSATGTPGRSGVATTEVARNTRPATGTRNTAGTEICKKVNDRRGCPAPCKAGMAHACDVLLQNGKVCSSSRHTRETHNEGQHGKWQARQ